MTNMTTTNNQEENALNGREINFMNGTKLIMNEEDGANCVIDIKDYIKKTNNVAYRTIALYTEGEEDELNECILMGDNYRVFFCMYRPTIEIAYNNKEVDVENHIFGYDVSSPFVQEYIDKIHRHMENALNIYYAENNNGLELEDLKKYKDTGYFTHEEFGADTEENQYKIFGDFDEFMEGMTKENKDDLDEYWINNVCCMEIEDCLDDAEAYINYLCLAIACEWKMNTEISFKNEDGGQI